MCDWYLSSPPQCIAFQWLFPLTEIIKAVIVLDSKYFRIEMDPFNLQILQTFHKYVILWTLYGNPAQMHSTEQFPVLGIQRLREHAECEKLLKIKGLVSSVNKLKGKKWCRRRNITSCDVGNLFVLWFKQYN